MKNECIYPDWQGGYETGVHKYDKDGFCIICGHKKQNNNEKENNRKNTKG